MRVGVMVVLFSLGVSMPGSVLADPDSSAAPAQAATTMQAPPVQPDPAMQAAPAQPAADPQSPAGASAPEHVVVHGAVASDTSGVNLDEIVCRNSPPATGTRLGGGRECHTVRQWNDRQRQEQRQLQQQQSVGFNSGGK